MQLLKSLMSLAMIAAVVYVGATVPLGNKTLFGHFSAIWGSDEAQQLVDGVRESSGPMLDKLDRAVTAGVEEARRQTGDGPDPADDATPVARGDDPAPAENEPAPGTATDGDNAADIEIRPQIDIRVTP